MVKLRTVVLFCAAACLPVQVMAQSSAGDNEVTGFAGIADGEATFGGAYAKALSEKLFAVGEFSYIALGSQSASIVGVETSAKAVNFNGGVHYNFPNLFGNKSRLVPYAGAGLGVTRVSVKASVAGFSGGGSDSSFLFNFGGGARYYVGPKWGIRPEVMVFAGDGSYARFTVGVFYHF